jgi:hypothetical protein
MLIFLISFPQYVRFGYAVWNYWENSHVELGVQTF